MTRESIIWKGAKIWRDECGNWCIGLSKAWPGRTYLVYMDYTKKEAISRFREEFDLHGKHIFRGGKA